MQLPAVDQNVCGQWIEQDLDYYNRLPVWFLAAEAQYRKYFSTFPSVLTGRFAWKAMQGDLLRTIIPEPTPVISQFRFPVKIAAGLPTTDVINYAERTTESAPAWQDFMSPTFYFKPEFSDFMTHVSRTKENIMEQITVFEDQFYRTFLWSKAPQVYIAGVGLVDAPTAEINAAGDAADSKTNAWLQAQLALLSGADDGSLSAVELFKILNVAENEVGMTPYSGSTIPKQGSSTSPLNEMYCLVSGAEVWNNWIGDPWIMANKPFNMNLVTEGFKGPIFGRIMYKIERFPLRFQSTIDYAPSQAPPQVRELNPDRENFNQTKMNPLYAKISNGNVGTTGGSPWAVAWLVGGPNCDIMDVGPPPAAFTQPLNGVIGMNWNGKVEMTKNIAVPCKTSDGATFIDVNSFGRYLRLQGTSSVGARATNIQNVLPILYKRTVGIRNPPAVVPA